MKLIIIGPQGSGKGTHAKMLAEKLGVPQISTGDVFRQMAKHDTEEGREIKYLIDNGIFVPDEMTLKILKKRLEEKDAKNGFILDGFPRNTKQAKMLDENVEIDEVLYLNVSDEECLRRLGGRTTCRSCSTIYGNENPPKTKGKCDKCGGELYVREDDTEETIRKRLQTYHEQTEPILDYYREIGLLIEVKIAGIKIPDEVFSDICDALGI
jgi:adenylate kinase